MAYAHKKCSVLLGFSLLGITSGRNPVRESSHSGINTGLIGLPTLISPAHYVGKVPDISSIRTKQGSSRVTLKKRESLVSNSSVHYRGVCSFPNLSLIQVAVFKSSVCSSAEVIPSMSFTQKRGAPPDRERKRDQSKEAEMSDGKGEEGTVSIFQDHRTQQRRSHFKKS